MRLFFPSAIILVVAFSASIGLIRAQPFDNDELRQFLLPPAGCAAPCWQGIRPGETTVRDVMALLSNHRWVRSVHYENYSRFSNGYIRWQWNAQRPSMILEDAPTNLWFDESITQNFHMLTDIRFGDVWLLLGEPDEFGANSINGHVQVRTVYYDAGIMVMIDIGCPRSAARLWQAPTDLIWLKEVPQAPTDSFSSPPRSQPVC